MESSAESARSHSRVVTAARRISASDTGSFFTVEETAIQIRSLRGDAARFALDTRVFGVGFDDFADEAMAHDVRFGEIVETNPLDAGENSLHLHQS